VGKRRAASVLYIKKGLNLPKLLIYCPDILYDCLVFQDKLGIQKNFFAVNMQGSVLLKKHFFIKTRWYVLFNGLVE